MPERIACFPEVGSQPKVAIISARCYKLLILPHDLPHVAISALFSTPDDYSQAIFISPSNFDYYAEKTRIVIKRAK